MIYTVTIHNMHNEIVDTCEGSAADILALIERYKHRMCAGYYLCVGASVASPS